MPTPLAVAQTFDRLPGYLFDNAWVTLVETLQGFALTVLIGLFVGLAISSSSLIERAILPVAAWRSTPSPSWPSRRCWWSGWGFGQGPKVVMVVLMCFFPIVLSTTTGLTTTPTDLVELARSLSASRWQTFTKVRIKSGRCRRSSSASRPRCRWP